MKITLSILILISVLISSCCTFQRIGNMVSTKTEKEIKEYWFDEIRTAEPTDKICYLDSYLPNQFYPNKYEFIDTFYNDKQILFAALLGPYDIFSKFTTVLARQEDSVFTLNLATESHGKFIFKGIARLSQSDFSIIIDSINTISNDILQNNNSKTYVDTVELNSCIALRTVEIEKFKNDTTGKYVLVYDPDSVDHQKCVTYTYYETFDEIISHCFDKQVICVLVNNLNKDLTYLPYPSNVKDSSETGSNYVGRLTEIFNSIEWKQLY